MKPDALSVRKIIPSLRYLSFLTQSYVMCALFAAIFQHQVVQLLGNYQQDASTLLVVAVFLLVSMLTEVYGYQQARRAIWCVGLFGLFLWLYGQLVIHLPSPHYASRNVGLNRWLIMNASPVAAFSLAANSFLSSYCLAKLKIYFVSLSVGYRLFLAAGLGVSGFSLLCGLFSTFAIYPFYQDAMLILLLLLPLFMHFTPKLKQLECLDISDQRTQFTPWSLAVCYRQQDNQFNAIYAQPTHR